MTGTEQVRSIRIWVVWAAHSGDPHATKHTRSMSEARSPISASSAGSSSSMSTCASSAIASVTRKSTSDLSISSMGESRFLRGRGDQPGGGLFAYQSAQP